MNIKYPTALASLLFLSTLSVCQADPLSFNNPFSTGSGGTGSTNPVYIGGSLGSSSTDSFCDGKSSCGDSDMGWKVFAGYDYSERVAIEIGYNSLGKMNTDKKTTEVTGYEIAMIGKMPLNDSIGLFGKAGMFRWEAKNDDGKRSAFDIMFGAGVDYKLNDNMSIRGEWERFNDIETKSDNTSDVDMISAGFTYRTL